MKKILLVCLLISAVIIGGVGLYAAYYWNALHTVEYQAEAHWSTFEIHRGESFQSVSDRLVTLGVVRDKVGFTLLARHTGARAGIQYGEYKIPNAYTYPALLALFTSGKVVQHSITFPEGWKYRDYLLALKAHPSVGFTLEGVTESQAANILGLHQSSIEGWLFPETYYFSKNTTDVIILKTALEKMRNQLQRHWEGRDKSTPLKSAYELLILASIVEKETSLDSERHKIAGVFVNRLNMGMRLQTDPTVIYGLGEQFDGNLTRKHLRQHTPYNTYRISGLPPTPIAMPGARSLEAVANPEKTSALYFVADGSGGHTFSDTLKAHNRAVRKYQLGQ